MPALVSRRHFFTRTVPALAVVPALGIFPDYGPDAVLPRDREPGWSESWPPTAHPSGRLWGIDPTPCNACGGVHDCYTSGCVPVLFAPDGVPTQHEAAYSAHWPQSDRMQHRPRARERW